MCPASEVRDRTCALLEQVASKGAYADRLPHQYSGGQRQRIAIARALAMQPDLLVLDEAVASLDVSVQAQFLNLFLDLCRELGLTALFISHDLWVVRHVCDRVAIIYLGRVVELASAQELYAAPKHPNTQAPFASPITPPPGCALPIRRSARRRPDPRRPCLVASRVPQRSRDPRRHRFLVPDDAAPHLRYLRSKFAPSPLPD